MIELIGLIGGALFAAGCIPIAWTSVQSGKGVPTPLSTQWLLFIALIFYSAYLFMAFGPHLPFWFLVVEVVCWGIALWYHYLPRRPGQAPDVIILEALNPPKHYYTLHSADVILAEDRRLDDLQFDETVEPLTYNRPEWHKDVLDQRPDWDPNYRKD